MRPSRPVQPGMKKQAVIPQMRDSQPKGCAVRSRSLRRSSAPQVGGQTVASWYWSGTEYANNTNNAGNFNTNNGNQNANNKGNNEYALAVLPGQ